MTPISNSPEWVMRLRRSGISRDFSPQVVLPGQAGKVSVLLKLCDAIKNSESAYWLENTPIKRPPFLLLLGTNDAEDYFSPLH